MMQRRGVRRHRPIGPGDPEVTPDSGPRRSFFPSGDVRVAIRRIVRLRRAVPRPPGADRGRPARTRRCATAARACRPCRAGSRRSSRSPAPSACPRAGRASCSTRAKIRTPLRSQADAPNSPGRIPRRHAAADARFRRRAGAAGDPYRVAIAPERIDALGRAQRGSATSSFENFTVRTSGDGFPEASGKVGTAAPSISKCPMIMLLTEPVVCGGSRRKFRPSQQ